MNTYNIKQLRSAVSKYTERSTYLGVVIFLTDSVIYVCAIAGVIFLETFALKVICSVIAGFKISTLSVIAHDAAHASLTNNKMLNKVIGRLAFLPSYHNYSLWLIAHNKSHHQSTNIQGKNSWSPLSKEEYDHLPGWRKHVEQFYRSPFGISFYYLVERWWKDKFFPYKRLVTKNKSSYWLDFLFVASYMAAFLCMLIQIGTSLTHTSPIELIVLAFFVPLVISSFMFGFTVYQHHTHENIPWFKLKEEKNKAVGVEEVTMCVKFPRWYNILGHNIMEHTAHHIDSRIPFYNLAKAQAVLDRMFGDERISINFSFKEFLSSMRKCKLYDYNNHLWLGFNGLPSCDLNTTFIDIEYKLAA